MKSSELMQELCALYLWPALLVRVDTRCVGGTYRTAACSSIPVCTGTGSHCPLCTGSSPPDCDCRLRSAGTSRCGSTPQWRSRADTLRSRSSSRTSTEIAGMSQGDSGHSSPATRWWGLCFQRSWPRCRLERRAVRAAPPGAPITSSGKKREKYQRWVQGNIKVRQNPRRKKANNFKENRSVRQTRGTDEYISYWLLLEVVKINENCRSPC